MNLWAGFLLLFLILALFFNVKVVYLALYTAAILVFAGGRLLERGFARLQVERHAHRTYLFPRERADLTIRFHNPSFAPFAWVLGYEHLPSQLAAGRLERWVLSLPPFGTAEAGYTVTSSLRGVYTVGPIEVLVGDPLGLHQRRAIVHTYHDVIVYPDIYVLPELGLPSTLPVGNVRAPHRIYPDPSRLAGVRPYQAGETTKEIHWKATARTGSLQVKQFEHTVALEAILMLNLNADECRSHSRYVDAELAVTTAAALANYLTDLGESFAFATNASLQYQGAEAGAPGRNQGGDTPAETEQGSPAGGGFRGASGIVRLPARKGSGQLMRVLEVLAAAVLGQGVPFAHLLQEESKGLSWGATLLLVTPLDSDELVEAGLMLAAAGYQVLYFVTTPRPIHPEYFYRAPRPSLRFYQVDHGSGDRRLHVEGGAAGG